VNISGRDQVTDSQILESSRVVHTVDFEWVKVGQKNFATSGPKFTRFFLPNAGKMAVDQVCFRLLIS